MPNSLYKSAKIASSKPYLLQGTAMIALLAVAACGDQEQADTDDKTKTDTNQTTTADELGKEEDLAYDVAPEPEEMTESVVVTAAKKPASGATSMDFAGAPPPQTIAQASPQPMPGDVDRDRFEDFDENQVKIVTEEPVSTFSIDVDTASYAVMRNYLNDGALPPRDAIRTEELINYFSYNYDLPEDKTEPFKANTFLYQTPWNEGTQLLHIGIKGYDIIPEKRPPANLVLLLDVSGSMDQPDKLPLLKKSMRLLVSQMDDNDTVAMVVYAGAAGTVLEPTKGSEKGKILAALDRLSAGGSTAGGEGIRQAYALAQASFKEDAVNRVILATDGDFNVGINDPERLEDFVSEKRETGVFLTVLGFGQGNYHDALMQKLAQSGNGNAAYIDTLREAQKVLVDEMGGTLFPIAKDVKLQVEFNPSQVSEYRLIGYETRLLNREDFNNDKVDAGDIGSGHSVTAIYEVVPTNSEARLTDPLRYEKPKAEVSTQNISDEVAFVRMRYKLPEEDTSKLIETPVMKASALSSLDEATPDIRFAASVAAFGQKLRGGKFLSDFDYSAIANLALSGKGNDEFGYRAEFIQLVRLAETAAAIPSLEPKGGHGN